MFTGIVQAVGRVVEVSPERLSVRKPAAWPDDPCVLGESISVNGCCLTLARISGPDLGFDLSPETFERTAFNRLSSGDPVNLERAMRPTDRFGGHIVQGHVDGTGRVLTIKRMASSWVYQFQVPEARYLVDKGSISINGVSLTVVDPQGERFMVWVVPHTHGHTSLESLAPGDTVNIEYDVVARYVEKILSQGLRSL